MTNRCRCSCRCTFRIGCVLIALSTTLWPLYMFSLDEDVVQIDFQEFHSTEERIYPALTLCFDRTTIYQSRNAARKGRKTAEQKRKVFSNQRTLKIEDYINSIVVKDKNDDETRFTSAGVNIKAEGAMQDKRLSMNAVLKRRQSTSCYSIGIPFMKKRTINSIAVEIRKDIFERKTFRTGHHISIGKNQFTVALAYQNKILPLLTRDGKKLKSRDLIDNHCSGFVFKVRGMEILRRRNKPSSPCNDYKNEDAITVLSDAASRLGCMPKGWDMASILPECQEKYVSKSATNQLKELYNSKGKYGSQPCRSFVDLWYDYKYDESIDSCTEYNDTLHISLVYKNHFYKEIAYYPAYSLWDLFSSIGLIMGLFFGGSLIQLPDLLTKIQDNTDTVEVRTSTREATPVNACIKAITTEIQMMKNEIAILKLPEATRLQRRKYETLV